MPIYLGIYNKLDVACSTAIHFTLREEYKYLYDFVLEVKILLITIDNKNIEIFQDIRYQFYPADIENLKN